MDEVAWIATGKDVEEATAKLEASAAAAGEWTQANAARFDEAKTEAVLFRRSRKEMPARKIQAGNHQVAYNKEAARWLGSLTPKEHHRIRMRKADKPKAGYAVSPVNFGRHQTTAKEPRSRASKHVPSFARNCGWKMDEALWARPMTSS